MRLPILKPAGTLSRRQFLKWAGAVGAAAALPAACSSVPPATTPADMLLADAAADALADAGPPVLPTFLTADERSLLSALADHVLPPDDAPGGAALGVVDYVERLLTALEVETPAIFAGGPYSGRQPFADSQGRPSKDRPDNEFAAFLALDRVNEAAWRLYLYGSDGVDGGGPNDAVLGKVVGLRDYVRELLAPGIEAAQAAGGTSGALDGALDADTVAAIFERLGDEARQTLIDLVSQGAFAAPEYGGNRDGAGWALCNYEGDSQPLGYSLYDEKAGRYRERPEAPVSTANPGDDPDPPDDTTTALIRLVVTVQGGQEFT
jgi:hypothetical protein